MDFLLLLFGFWIGALCTLLFVRYKQKKALKQFGTDFQRRQKKPFNNFYSDEDDGGSDV